MRLTPLHPPCSFHDYVDVDKVLPIFEQLMEEDIMRSTQTPQDDSSSYEGEVAAVSFPSLLPVLWALFRQWQKIEADRYQIILLQSALNVKQECSVYSVVTSVFSVLTNALNMKPYPEYQIRAN
jgi:hypothetical protein